VFEIGNSLREARLRQTLDLVDVEQATKIRSKYIRALEEERFELLPAQTYVKGFLRSYADYLGLDGQLYVDEYNSRYVVGDDEAALRARRSRQTHAQRRVESRVLLAALAGIAAAGALVVIAWQWGSPEDQAVRAPNPPTTTQPAPARTTAKPPGAWLALDLRAIGGNCTLTVRRGGAGGRDIYVGTLEKGQRVVLTGKTLWLQASNPANLVARIDGGRFRVPRTSGPLVAVVTRRGIVPTRAS
jgi:cytoskeleton protein RodZ